MPRALAQIRHRVLDLNANVFANYANIYAGIITCGMTVTVLNYFSGWLQKRFTTWH